MDIQPSAAQDARQTKWAAGCYAWSSTQDIWRYWQRFHMWIAARDECDVDTARAANGFQCWMIYYMKKGPGGWGEYPYPPLLPEGSLP